jgi:hypothetical protein
MAEFFVYDEDFNIYSNDDIDKIININNNSPNNYNITLFCFYCHNFIYLRPSTKKIKAQFCHFKNEKCIIKKRQIKQQ